MALDFVAGCIGGCAGVIVGHPLDTIKVHLQTQNSQKPKYRGTLHCFKSIVAKEGLRGIYKGLSSPLAGVAAINAIVFGVYGNTQRHLGEEQLMSHCFAGGAAGLLQSFFCSPMELAKTRLQVSEGNQGPFQCLQEIYGKEGCRGVFRGLNATILREVPAFGAYFLTYEWLTRNEANKPVSTSTMLVAGGCAGIVSWVVVYPVDVIKSRMQINGMLGETQYCNSMDCLRKSIRSEGYKFLYKGLAPTLLRAFPVNAATFAVVTWTMRLLGGGEALWGRCTDAVYTLKVSEAAPV